jgi:hypothetical protein
LARGGSARERLSGIPLAPRCPPPGQQPRLTRRGWVLPCAGPTREEQLTAPLLIGYARVSTDEQDLTAQREALAAPGVRAERTYVDHGLTGTNRDRPRLREALAACSEGDTLVVTKFDRLARSLPDAGELLDDLTCRHVKLSLAARCTTPTTPSGGCCSTYSPWSPNSVPDTPGGKINSTDPDSRLLKAPGIGYVQGHNAQAAVNERQIVLAAEISVESPDFGHLEAMVDATVCELQRAGVAGKPKVAVADAGYWHHDQMDSLAGDGIQVLIAPDAGQRKSARPGWQGGRYEWVRRVLATELGQRLYKETLADGRADVRAHQAQPRHEQVPPTRQLRSTHRMAPDRGHPQPHQAPQPHPSGRNGVKRGRTPRLHRHRVARRRPPAGRFPRQPRLVASVLRVERQTRGMEQEEASATRSRGLSFLPGDAEAAMSPVAAPGHRPVAAQDRRVAPVLLPLGRPTTAKAAQVHGQIDLVGRAS